MSLFRNRNFVYLWSSQIVSSLGDWIGLFAVLAIAQRISAGSVAFGTWLVMMARIVPGFLFAPVGGVLVDRWDRRRTMVVADICRAALLAVLPFVDTIWLLFLVSFGLELFAMLWQPAKEATIPNIVSRRQLVDANSLGLGAAYGTFPIGAAVFAGLAVVARLLGGLGVPLFDALEVSQESIAVWVDALTFLVAASLIFRLEIPSNADSERRDLDWGLTWRELKEGWSFIGQSDVVQLVIVGLGVSLLGGAAVIPLGPAFATDVLRGGPAAYGLVMTAFGCGVGLGVLTTTLLLRARPSLSVLQVFPAAVLCSGTFLVLAASISNLGIALGLVAAFGMGAGSAYITGFTALQDNTSDDMRGRVFASLLTIVRACVLLGMTLAPLVEGLFSSLRERLLPAGDTILGVDFELSGTRLALWFSGLLIVGTGIWALRARRRIQVAS